ncbi:MAG: triose-phosphate isomerase, partial [Victivallales bacterium]
EISGKDTGLCEIIACVPFVDLQTAVEAAKGSAVKIGAQNVHWASSGAFTGEISAAMLKEIGVEYVIIGHSERRQYFGETDITVNSRVKAALESGLKVILCVGELLAEREQGVTAEVVSRQTKIDLLGITEAQMKDIIIAYEPVWAIGTGKTATSDQADEVCGFIRDVLVSLYGKNVAEATTIQYGGSMNAKNAAELLSKVNVDGGLIGGASLKADDFAVIIEAALN